jgi:transposase InsO family protein
VEPAPDFAQLQLRMTDQMQWRYELIRPLVLLEEGTPAQRAQETQTHPDTVRTFVRRFTKQGLLGLVTNDVEVVKKKRSLPVSEEVQQEIHRLKALHGGFRYRELARILFYRFHERVDVKTIKQLWLQSPVAASEQLEFWTYQSYPDRLEARLHVIKLFYQGWNKSSISRFLHVSRPTIDRWLARFEADHVASLMDKKGGPTSPRKMWFPLMVEVYHLQKHHPDAGEFRIWSLLGRSDVAPRTVGRIMAINKQVYDDIPHVAKKGPKPSPQPHPYKATRPHQYWFIDGRKMDFETEGVRWWSLIVLEGYSRTMVAGAIVASESSWAALMVLYSACVRYGVPESLISDSGGAFTSNEFEAVCGRLGIVHRTIVSTQGESYLNWMETHFNVQRRLYDYQLSLAKTPAKLEQAHQAFLHLYNTTAHQGLLKDGFDPPIPLEALGEARGRMYSEDELAPHFSHALFPRTTNRYGCVTLHSSHFYVERGLPQTRVWLWVYDEQLRAVFDQVVLAQYRCRYDRQTHQVQNIHDGVFFDTPFASPQGLLIALDPQDAEVVKRPPRVKQQAIKSLLHKQLDLFNQILRA